MQIKTAARLQNAVYFRDAERHAHKITSRLPFFNTGCNPFSRSTVCVVKRPLSLARISENPSLARSSHTHVSMNA